MQTQDTNIVYRRAIGAPVKRDHPDAPQTKPVAKVRDFVAFLANPGHLPHAAPRNSESYYRERDDELAIFCKQLNADIDRPLAKRDLTRVKPQDAHGWKGATPLHIAARYRSASVLKQLLLATADARVAINQRDASGRTVLEWADMRPEGKRKDAVVQLLRNKAKIGDGMPVMAKRPTLPTKLDLLSQPPGTRKQALLDILARTSRGNPSKTSVASTGEMSAKSRQSNKSKSTPEKSNQSKKVTAANTRLLSPTKTVNREHNDVEYKQRITIAVAPSKKNQMLQQFEAQFSTCRAHHGESGAGMEALRQKYMQVQNTTLPAGTPTEQLTSEQAEEERNEKSDSNSGANLRAECIALSPSKNQDNSANSIERAQHEHANPTATTRLPPENIVLLSPENRPQESTNLGEELDQKSYLISTLKENVQKNADYRSECEALKAEIMADPHLNERSRSILLRSVKRQIDTFLPNDRNAIDEFATMENLRTQLASSRTTNSAQEEGLKRLHSQYAGSIALVKKQVPPPTLTSQQNITLFQTRTGMAPQGGPLAMPTTRPDSGTLVSSTHRAAQQLTYKQECTRNTALQTRLSNLADRVRKDKQIISPEYAQLLNDINNASQNGKHSHPHRQLSHFLFWRAPSQAAFSTCLRNINNTLKDEVERLENRYRSLPFKVLMDDVGKIYVPSDEQRAIVHVQLKQIAPKSTTQLDRLNDKLRARIAALLPNTLIEEANAVTHQSTGAGGEAMEKCLGELRNAKQRLTDDHELKRLQEVQSSCAKAVAELSGLMHLLQTTLVAVERMAEQTSQSLAGNAVYCQAKALQDSLDTATEMRISAFHSGTTVQDENPLASLDAQRIANFRAFTDANRGVAQLLTELEANARRLRDSHPVS